MPEVFPKYFLFMKHTYSIIFFFTLLISNSSIAQHWEWVRSATAASNPLGMGAEVTLLSLCKDSKGHIYCTGGFSTDSGTVHFDNYFFSGTDGQISKFLLLKYNANGHVNWAKTSPFINDSGKYYGVGVGKCMAFDTADNYIVAGTYQSNKMIFDNDTLVNNYYDSTFHNLFIVKYNKQGVVLWVNQIQTSFLGTAYPSNIIIDKTGSFYITGSFDGLFAVFNQDTIWNNTGAQDCFIAKYQPNGQLAWVSHPNGPNREWGNSMALIDGFVYLVGGVDGPFINFGSTTLYNPTFIAKYDTAGSFIWAKGNDSTEYLSLKTGGHKDLYLSGYYYNGAVIGNNILQTVCPNNPYASNAFLAQLDTSGNVNWAKEAGKGLGYPMSMVLDKVGRLWLGGYYLDSSFICGNDTLPNVTTDPSYPGDVFIASYDTVAGNPLKTIGIGGSSEEILYSILVDKDSLYVCGSYSSPVLSFGSFNIYSQLIGCFNWFFAKYVLPPAGVNEVPKENEVNVYPNPFIQTIFLQTTNPKQETFSLYDSFGKLILTKTIEASKEQINTAHLAAGLYFYSIVNKNGERVKAGKVLKE